MTNDKCNLRDSGLACLKNGRRLLDDAQFLEFCEPPTTGRFLIMIAEEEFSKAFLLGLVLRDVIPWNKHLLRPMRDHSCKQLLCLIMDYLSPDTEEFIERCNAVVLRREIPELPPQIGDAINILRHEKIGRWVAQSWVWAEEPEYDPVALSIAEGKQDKLKQDALYVRLGQDGSTASVPQGGTYESIAEGRMRAQRIASLAEGVLAGSEHPGLDYDLVEAVFRVLFASLGTDSG
jgi:hypothetical protein